MSDQILDYSRKQKGYSRFFNVLYGIALLLFAYWFIADFRAWPFESIALLTGLSLLFVVTVVRFFGQKERKLFQYFYLAGKLVLMAAIYIHLIGLDTNYFIWIAAGCFGGGLLLLTFKK
jgi:hypothetical protein